MFLLMIINAHAESLYTPLVEAWVASRLQATSVGINCARLQEKSSSSSAGRQALTGATDTDINARYNASLTAESGFSIHDGSQMCLSAGAEGLGGATPALSESGEQIVEADLSLAERYARQRHAIMAEIAIAQKEGGTADLRDARALDTLESVLNPREVVKLSVTGSWTSPRAVDVAFRSAGESASLVHRAVLASFAEAMLEGAPRSFRVPNGARTTPVFSLYLTYEAGGDEGCPTQVPETARRVPHHGPPAGDELLDWVVDRLAGTSTCHGPSIIEIVDARLGPGASIRLPGGVVLEVTSWPS